MASEWHHSYMAARPKLLKALRLALFAGILVLELSVIAALSVLPEIQARNAPLGHWEMETPFADSSWLPFVLISLLAAFVLANIGLLITIWRAVRDLR
jgi:hypothetical protein